MRLEDTSNLDSSAYSYRLFCEVASAREIFGAATVKARFGTSPGIWNAAMVAMAAVVPKAGRGKCCSPRHMMPFFSVYVFMYFNVHGAPRQSLGEQ